MLYYEVSALTGKNIKEAIRDITIKMKDYDLVPYFDMEQVQANDVLNDEDNQTGNSYFDICGC